MIPLVSIGIPNFNYAHYICSTLDSVVNQTYRNIELIIVDDLSTDNSIKVIDDWINKYRGPMKVIFIKNTKNSGLTRVCNQILNAANGKYFQPLDADDQIFPDKIENQVDLLESSNNAAFVYSNMTVINENGIEIYDDYLKKIGYDENNMPNGNIFNQLFEFNFVPLPSVLINIDAAKEIGGFDENLGVQDYYLWLKLSEKYNVIFDNRKTAIYREHLNSMSASPETNPRFFESVLKLKYSYFSKANTQIQKIIKKNVEDTSIYMYTMNYSNSKKWLALNLYLNPGIKSLIYFMASKLSLSYLFFAKIKSFFSNSDAV